MQQEEARATYLGLELPEARVIRPPGPVIRWTVRVLALVAVCMAGYLSWISLQAGDAGPGCAGLKLFDCESVTSSRWSVWLGRVPVSVPAMAVYGLIFVATLLIEPRLPVWLRRSAWVALMPLLILAAGAALWFLALLAFAVDGLCLWCLIVHACGLTIAGLLAFHLPVEWGYELDESWLSDMQTTMLVFYGKGGEEVRAATVRLSTAVELWLLGLVGLAVLIFGQLIWEPERFTVEEIAAAEAELEAPKPLDAPGPRVIWDEEQQKPVFVRDIAPSSGEEEAEEPDPLGVLPGPRPADPAAGGVSVVELGAEQEADPAEAGPGPRWIPLLDGKARLTVAAHPVLGDPDAPYVVIELFDYTCKHCRKLYEHLEEARQEFGDQLAVVVLPVPMSTKCNDFIEFTHRDHQNACRYASIALGVWKADPEKFEAFHHWLMSGEGVPSIVDTKERAAGLVGSDALDEAMYSAAVRMEIRHNVKLYDLAGRGSIPKLLASKFVVTGEADSARQLVPLLERITGAKAGLPGL